MILAILQARMSSSRLPGKVLKPILGRPMLGRQLDRLKRSKRIGRVVLATSEEPSDDPIVAFCAAEGVACHRGPLNDVLGRFEGALAAFGPAEHVVRLTADCPLADWTIIDQCIDRHLETGADYTSNGVERTYPDGLDVEVMKAATLLRAAREASPGPEREHVTMYIYRHPELFRLASLTQSPDLQHERWTVDTPADFRMVEEVFAQLQHVKPDFTQGDVLALHARRPDIRAINLQKAA